MDPVLALPIRVSVTRDRTLLGTLHEQLRAAILDGRLQPGLRLPSTRALASTYGVSRNTAVATYDLLLSEGYLATRPRAGAYVADVVPRVRHRGPAESERAQHRRLNPFWRAVPTIMPPELGATSRFEFRLGVGEKRQFPFDIWRRLSARSMRAFATQPAVYAAAQGRSALLQAIAKHVSFTRMVACRDADVVVTSGSQQAFDLLARILVTAGRTIVAVEDPGYPAMRAAFGAVGANVVPVPVDGEGLVVAEIPPDANVICVTPSHQFPLGTAMSMRRRTALIEFAHARNAVVVEDDYDGEFRFGGRPLDALQSLDRTESVFYVGTFSKSLFPGIRLGFVVAPAWARPALLAAKQCSDWHCPVIEQDTLAAFISEGHMARHVRKMRQIYRRRLELLLARLERDFHRWLEPIPSQAGLHVAAFAKAAVDIDAIVARARERDVGVYSLARYYAAQPGRSGLIFGYGSTDEDDIVEGLARLRRAWTR